MSIDAIIMFIVAIALIWGGLAMAIIKLRQHTDPPADPDDPDGAAGSENPGGSRG
ncbi:methionine/alanine import family NSS transporter small subunit [Haloechinothrix sp. LS1_15]|uniref:methionine/alanine import family NSS transporter small subunit n=1 Tax=Haloechinothrix sp. LS1_15 TaxID=2652248 RepID=UPI0029461F28|nr:methionine/alanine import family NSS transporter small subunit [Haloechinothrix sp. LS1_15]MDV6014060.1 methionine/alanine import family NSS transporter small subunit [Haloechinothrix sp. LS1_15]